MLLVPLALGGLLPDGAVAVGARWKVGEAAARSLTGYDTLASNGLEATLESDETLEGGLRRHPAEHLSREAHWCWASIGPAVLDSAALFLAHWLDLPQTSLTGAALVLLYVLNPLQSILDSLPDLDQARVAVENIENLGLSPTRKRGEGAVEPLSPSARATVAPC